MVSRLAGAIIRAILAMVLAVLPSVLLPGVGADTKQMACLVALFVGLMVFVEYNAEAPSLIEFRDAAPFNRCRYGLALVLVLALTLCDLDRSAPSALSGLVAAVAMLLGQVLDFAGSPVRLARGLLAEGAGEAAQAELRAAAGLAYAVGLVGIVAVMALLRLGKWPQRGPAFNVWVNLPTFDPTMGNDVLTRLKRDAGLNIALGISLPFFVPLGVQHGLGGFQPETLVQSQSLIWVMTAWVFVPASLLLRGVAMLHVAQMVLQKRRDRALSFDGDYLPA